MGRHSALPVAGASPSEDAKEVCVFDPAGRRLETRDAETNLLSLSIEYDAEGRIENVRDWRGVDDALVLGGRVTAVTRAGDDVTVTGPDGHATLLALDADGWLESVRPPDGSSSEAYGMTYDTGSATGLLKSFRKPVPMRTRSRFASRRAGSGS